MGRHSQGSAEGTPPPLPDPPGRHPYAPRSVEDTGVWDHSTYRVVDVGLPSGAVPAAPAGGSTAAFPLGGSAPGRDRTDARDALAPRGGPLRSVPEFGAPPSRYGAPQTGSREELRPPAAEPPPYGATRADLAEPSRPRAADTGHYAALLFVQGGA